MARARNPRVVAVERLRQVKRDVAALIDRWTVGATVSTYGYEMRRVSPKYYPGLPVGADGLVEVKFSTSDHRPRALHEYPEADPQRWAHLYQQASELMLTLDAIRTHAADEYRRLTAVPPGTGGVLQGAHDASEREYRAANGL